MDESKSHFLQLTKREQKGTLEALIFASDEPISDGNIYKILINNGLSSLENKDLPDIFNIDSNVDLSTNNKIKELDVDFNYFEELIKEINLELLETHRPFQIIHVGGGYQYATRKEYDELLHILNKSKSRRRLSHASLEVLAIIAYRQPVTKPEIEQVRGVNSSEVVNSLIDKNFVEVKGRKDALGRPLLYGTTLDFLKAFGLNSIEDLPKLRELEEYSGFDLSDQPSIELKVDETLHADLKEFDELQYSDFISIEQAEKVIEE